VGLYVGHFHDFLEVAGEYSDHCYGRALVQMMRCHATALVLPMPRSLSMGVLGINGERLDSATAIFVSVPRLMCWRTAVMQHLRCFGDTGVAVAIADARLGEKQSLSFMRV
jgi:hypothetical protein